MKTRLELTMHYSIVKPKERAVAILLMTVRLVGLGEWDRSKRRLVYNKTILDTYSFILSLFERESEIHDNLPYNSDLLVISQQHSS